MLWSYAKLPVAPPAVVFALVHKITDQLVLQAHRPDGASTFDAQVRPLGNDLQSSGQEGASGGVDQQQATCGPRIKTRLQSPGSVHPACVQQTISVAYLLWCVLLACHTQALSNSIWALAHLKSRGMEVDALRHPDLMRFLNELAGAAARAMVRPHATLAPPGSNGEPRLPECQRYLALVEREFSCQVRTLTVFCLAGYRLSLRSSSGTTGVCTSAFEEAHLQRHQLAIYE